MGVVLRMRDFHRKNSSLEPKKPVLLVGGEQKSLPAPRRKMPDPVCFKCHSPVTAHPSSRVCDSCGLVVSTPPFGSTS